ncbi:MAG: type II toxin-antitoxin system VapC family toxin [Acidimicrobiales bacterium]
MIVLDTTILVYSGGRQPQLRERCQSLLVSIEQKQIRATTSVEVIQEFCHIRARRTGAAEAAARAKDHLDLLRPLLRPDEDDLTAGLAAYAASGGRPGAFDAVLGATAQRRGLPVVSADRGFGRVGGLTWLNPASSSFLEDCLSYG